MFSESLLEKAESLVTGKYEDIPELSQTMDNYYGNLSSDSTSRNVPFLARCKYEGTEINCTKLFYPHYDISGM